MHVSDIEIEKLKRKRKNLSKPISEPIEKLIEKETGRIIDGKALWNELENSLCQYEGEDGIATIIGEDNQKERWEYEIDLKRTYDKEFDQWESNMNLLEIKILNKKTQRYEYIKIQGAEL